VLAFLDGRPLEHAAVACLSASVIGVSLRWLGQKLTGSEGLGWGDVKLAVALAVPLTLENLALFLSVMAASAVVLLTWAAWRRQYSGIPLGPALLAGAFAAFI